ncbi:MAG: phosphoglycerate dehydrogenase [Lachnospiraceae bacterium]|nr:phosphoglycerate dehydrogenase [Lachnospiraceae bacterium]
MKFVLTHALDDAAMQYLKDNDVTVWIADSADVPSYVDELKDADALIIRSGECRADVMDQCPKLKVVAHNGIGYDNMDVAHATELGIACAIAKGSNAQAVAEHTLAMILAFAKDLKNADEGFHNGNWAVRDAGRSFELGGKKVGIIGVGGIGRILARLCEALGMQTLGFQTGDYPASQKKEEVESAGCIYYDDMEKLLADSDFVSVHVPLNPSTRGLIGKEELACMKKTAYLINNSRGGIVDEQALADALNADLIAGAAADVFTTEPVTEDQPLLAAKNFIGTPHSAALAKEAKARMMMMTAQNCVTICTGGITPNVVDMSVYEHRR